SDGTALTGVLTPPTQTGGNQTHTAAGALEDGRFVIVWYDEGAKDIRAQVFNADGTTDGTETNLVDYFSGSSTTVGKIDVEGFDDGRFQVAWQADLNGFNNNQIYSQIFDPRSFANSPNAYTDHQVIGTTGADTIGVVASDFYVNGWTGDDILDFGSGSAINLNDVFDGSTGFDTLRLSHSATLFDFQAPTVLSFESVEFLDGLSVDRTVRFDSFQFGNGRLASTLLVDGNTNPNSDDTVEVYMTDGLAVDLSDFTFKDWQGANTGHDIVRIIGDDSGETFIGTSMDDEMIGNGGDDTFVSGPGADVVNGGAGIDTMSYAHSNAGVTVELQYNVFYGGDATGDTLSGIEYLYGSGYNDALYGNPSDNIIRGGAGNDHIKGLNGADQLYGDVGDDWLYVDNLDTVAQGGDGTDRLIVVSTAGVTKAVGADGIEIATGNVGNDHFLGGAATVGLTLRGRAGDDILRSGSGNDYLYGESGADELRGGAGIDRLFVDENDTIIDGGAGNQDRVIVQQLASATVGVTIDMVASNVEIAYGNFNDDTFDGSSATVALSLYGRQGQDTLSGGSASDHLFGDGNDAAAGDILNGGGGNDYLHGGENGAGGFAERDQFIFDADWGNDRIFDFA
ncbi:MAG: hypothetical protein KDJ77_15070, partial [Rhodobiaceae bacterium]|nr:hypothetical protein [Rhodobiaceae bacterium]